MSHIIGEELKQLVEQATQKIKEAKNNTEINAIVEDLVTQTIGSEFASLWVFDKDHAKLIRARDNGTPNELSVLDQAGLLAMHFFTLSGGIYNYLASEKGYVPHIDNPDNIKIKSKIIVPIVDGENLIGMVTAYSSVRKIKNFDQNDMALLEAMVPFLTEVIYTMYPDMRHNKSSDVYIGERLREQSEQLIQKAEAIRQEEKASHNHLTNATHIAQMVHDIRTPANTLYGFLELLEEEIDDDRLLRYIHNAKQSAMFINALTTSILDGDTVSNKKQDKEDTVTASKFFADIAEEFSPNMYRKHIRYGIYIDPMLPKEIAVAQTKLKRVIMNLLSNAYKFTPEGQSIEFSVEYDGENRTLRIAVTDTGIGIPEEKQQEIFKAYKQADDSVKEQYGGTGLGLHITSEYVKEFGGELTLSSQVDQGSRFSFEIPVRIVDETPSFLPSVPPDAVVALLIPKSLRFYQDIIQRYFFRLGIDANYIVIMHTNDVLPDEITHVVCFEELWNDQTTTMNKPLFLLRQSMFNDDNAPNVPQASRYEFFGPALAAFLAPSGIKRVLIADDDRINIDLLRSVLDDEFVDIQTARDGVSALALFEQGLQTNRPFHLAFIDKHMPGLSGSEVIHKVRKLEKQINGPSVFAVSITGESKEDESDRLFDMKVTKPFSKKKIKQALKKAFKARST